jgi:hypothetical protein
LGRYESAIEILKQGAVPLIQGELASIALVDLKAQLASELSDCFGIMGGIYRRWGLESDSEQDRLLHLRESVDAYEKGYEVESDPEYNIVNSYNMVNRLVSYLLLEPNSLSDPSTPGRNGVDVSYNVGYELEKAESVVREQLKEKRRGDVWALADLAMLSLLLNLSDPTTAYADFIANSPPSFAYESALATLRPMAEVNLPMAEKLREAVRLLEGKLKDQL